MERKRKVVFPDDTIYWTKEDISSLKTKYEEKETMTICFGENVRQWIDDLLSRDSEVIGFLLGQAYGGENDSCLVVDGALQAKFVQGDESNFRFTHESWQDIQAMRENHYPNKQIVGWFRSHSGAELDFSTNDLVVHKLFFKQPWQVAYLLCSASNERKFFRWKGKKVVPTSYFSLTSASLVEEDEPKVLVSQKRRKRNSSRKIFFRRLISSLILVALVTGLTLSIIEFWNNYGAFFSWNKVSSILQQGIDGTIIFVQKALEMATQR